jgi:hypothetical protein
VTLLVDHYHADWERLWWVRAGGVASIVESGKPHAAAVDLLAAKYDQYRRRRPRDRGHGESVERMGGIAKRFTGPVSVGLLADDQCGRRLGQPARAPRRRQILGLAGGR